MDRLAPGDRSAGGRKGQNLLPRGGNSRSGAVGFLRCPKEPTARRRGLGAGRWGGRIPSAVHAVTVHSPEVCCGPLGCLAKGRSLPSNAPIKTMTALLTSKHRQTLSLCSLPALKTCAWRGKNWPKKGTRKA